MQVVKVNGEECAVNADGAYVLLDRIREIDKLRDELVEQLCAEAETLGGKVSEFKDRAQSEVFSFADISADEHGVKVRGRKGGFSIMSYDGLRKIVVDNDTLISVNEKVTIAREAVFACVRRWSDGANQNLVEIVRRAFETDKQGHLSLARLLSLRSYRIDDPEWEAAMEALSQGLSAFGTKTYLRYYKRPTTAAKFTQVALG